MTHDLTRARILPKPRIRLERSWLTDRLRWVCRGGMSIGVGPSPRAAYGDWLVNTAIYEKKVAR